MSKTLPWRKPSYGPLIETSLTEAEARELERLAKGKRVLEIGAAYGYSTVLMALVAEFVVSCDPHLVHDSLGIFTDNLVTYGVDGKVGHLVGMSKIMLSPLYEGEFGLIFIDGDHTADGVRFDRDLARALIATGGHIAFHDWDEVSCPQVRPTLEEWRPPDYLVDTLAVYVTATI